MRKLTMQDLLCPCCGARASLSIPICSCGARFIGDPLYKPPTLVRSFGPAISSVALLGAITLAAVIFTKWLALAAILVIWTSRRAMRLTREQPQHYGGYRAAAATLVLTLTAGAVSAALGIAYIPRYIRNRAASEQAATKASIHHLASLLEEYKQKYGSYPSPAEYPKVVSEDKASDQWSNAISYRPHTELLAEARRPAEIPTNNFELRSAGPDGKLNTADDIVMQDGLFVNAEVHPAPLTQTPTVR